MTEIFLNPWFMVAAGVLVLAPIIIHLINRMRFKRIRWAAMEFLLKSQKRNRRRLIIEQLILLALRCLLVLLVGFLVSRFIGFSLAFMRKQSTLHVVVLDNTLSMSDRWKDKGITPTSSFEEAKRLLKEKVARNAVQASSVQHMKVFLLTDLETPIFDERLNEESLKKLAKELDDRAKDPSDLHVAPIEALRKARAVFGEKSFDAGEHVFHFLSDFRERDWKDEHAKELQNELGGLAEKAKVYLIDTADPNRGDSRQVLVHHDNVGIVDLRPQVTIVPENEPIKLFVTVNNFTNKKFENLNLTVRVNNEIRFEATQPLQNVPPGLSMHRFQLSFNKQGFNLIQATLDDPADMSETGLKADNDRFAVVEVRNMVDILVIDGDNPNPNKDPARAPEGSGTYFLEKVLSTSKGYRVVPGRLEDLDKPHLAQYPCIYLLNVPEIKDQELANLERYVKAGGGVCFFLGDKVKPTEYNRLLYDGGKGIFPAPLSLQPTEDKVEELERVQRLLNREPNLFVRTPTHPLFTSVYEEDTEHKTDAFFMFLNFDRYYSVPGTARWKEPGQVEELFTLPNRRSLDAYKQQAFKLVQEIPVEDERFKEYRAGLEYHQRALIAGLTRNYTQLFELSNAIYALLHDQGKQADPEKPEERVRPNLVEFWAKKEVDDLRKRLEEFNDTIRFGDPLMISKLVGQGRVVACLTSASTKMAGAAARWNDWADGPGAPSYVVFMPALRKYLASVTQSQSFETGTPVSVTVPEQYYEAKADVLLQPLEPRTDRLTGAETDDEKDKKLMDLKAHQQVAAKDGLLTFTFKGAAKAGLYLYKLYPKLQEGASQPLPPEKRPFVFNVDTNVEGDLRRALSDTLAREATGTGEQGKVTLLHALSDFSTLSNRQTDMSESPWLYLIFLIVLIVEQALAVHLSFHTKPGTLQAPAAVAPAVASVPAPREEEVAV
jgi:hypothetical protein